MSGVHTSETFKLDGWTFEVETEHAGEVIRYRVKATELVLAEARSAQIARLSSEASAIWRIIGDADDREREAWESGDFETARQLQEQQRRAFTDHRALVEVRIRLEEALRA